MACTAVSGLPAVVRIVGAVAANDPLVIHTRAGDDQVEVAAEGLSENVIALDEALARLSQEDPLAAELVKLRYFAGLTLAQTAEALGVSPRTADRCWAYAKAWLYYEIAKGESGPTGEAGE